MSLNSLTLNGQPVVGAIIGAILPHAATKLHVLAYCKGPGSVSGGSDGAEIGTFQVKKKGGSRWFDYTLANSEICPVASDEASTHTQLTLVGGLQFRFTVSDDRTEAVDIEIDLQVS